MTLFEDGYYRVPDWAEYGWLAHGFGTRAARNGQAAPAEKLASMQQIHSAEVLVAEHTGMIGTGDALVCGEADILVSVKTADCLPVLLVDTATRAVAAVHAGWRGTAAGIVRKALETMTQRFGTNPGDVETAIGPGIGVCCFEVGADVARQLGVPGTHADLEMLNAMQLEGVKRIHRAGMCTVCRGQAFFSFRRDKEAAGRMISYIGQRVRE